MQRRRHRRLGRGWGGGRRDVGGGGGFGCNCGGRGGEWERSGEVCWVSCRCCRRCSEVARCLCHPARGPCNEGAGCCCALELTQERAWDASSSLSSRCSHLSLLVVVSRRHMSAPPRRLFDVVEGASSRRKSRQAERLGGPLVGLSENRYFNLCADGALKQRSARPGFKAFRVKCMEIHILIHTHTHKHTHTHTHTHLKQRSV